MAVPDGILEVFETKTGRYVQQFRALAEPTRLKILFLLKNFGELCVCELTDALGITQSGISYHLRVLVEASLVLKSDRGTWSYYRLNDETVAELLSSRCCSILQYSCGEGSSSECRSTELGRNG